MLCAGASFVWTASASAAGIPFAQLPPAIQRGVLAQVKNGKLGEIQRQDYAGKVGYTFEITRDGYSRDYTLDENGAPVSVEFFLQETPPSVQKTIQSVLGPGKLGVIEKTLEDGKARFQVEWTMKEGDNRSCTILESGKLESTQVGIKEPPPPVQAAIAREVGTGLLKGVYKSFEGNAVYYDVVVNRGGAEDHDFTVSDRGQLESRQYFLAELALGAQSTITRIIGTGKLLRIDEVFEKRKGGFPFEIESSVNGKPYNFSVGPNGKFLGVNP